MTLDEAIAKAKADGDVQLVEWLRQARGADAASRWYTEKLRDANRTIRKLLDENDKLRKLVKHLHECEEHDDCEGCEYEADDVCDFEHDMQELGIEAHVKEDE